MSRAVAAILLSVTLPAAAHAGSSPDTLTLSLEEVLVMAAFHNVAALTAGEAVAAQQAARREALAAFLPSVSAGGSYADSWGEGDGGLPDGGDATLGLSVTASWTLWNGGGRIADLRRQNASLRRAEASLWQTRQQVLRSSIDAYLRLVEALHTQGIAEQSLVLAESTGEQTEALLRAGKATMSDVLRATVNIAQRRTAVVSARNAVTTSRRTLSDLLGGSFVVIHPVEPQFDPDRLMAMPLPRASCSPPSVAMAEAGLAQAKAATLAQTSRFLPRLTASATSSWNEHDGALGEPVKRGSLALSWSLFEGGARCFALQGAKAAERSALWSLQDAGRLSESKVEQARTDMGAAGAQWEAALQTVALAEDSYALETELYSLGRSTSLEVLSAQDALNSARSAEISSRYRILGAYAQLCEVLGSLDTGMFTGSRLRQEEI